MKDKDFCQQYFILILFAEICQIGIKSGNVSDRVIRLKETCIDYFMDRLRKHCKDFGKMRRRIERKALLPIYALFTDKQTNLVNTHKLILGLHPIILAMKNEGMIEKDIEDTIEEFFVIEGEQDATFDGKSISDSDWIKLKASADKKIDELAAIIREI